MGTKKAADWMVPNSGRAAIDGVFGLLYLTVSEPVQVSPLFLYGIQLELQTGHLRHQVQLLGLQGCPAQELLPRERKCGYIRVVSLGDWPAGST